MFKLSQRKTTSAEGKTLKMVLSRLKCAIASSFIENQAFGIHSKNLVHPDSKRDKSFSVKKFATMVQLKKVSKFVVTMVATDDIFAEFLKAKETVCITLNE